MGKVYSGTGTISSYNIGINAPVDTRMVVDTIAALNDYSTFTTTYYVGMTTYVVEAQAVYVLVSVPTGSTINVKKNWASQATWVKLSDISSDQLGSPVVDSIDELTDGSTITFAYKGMLVVVNDNSETSEDESGLYVLTNTPATEASNWMKVVSTSTGTDTSAVINTSTDTAPTSGSGLTISTTNSTDVEEVYVDDDETGFIADTYYTSRGLNSDLTNDNSDSDQTLASVDYIILTNGGNSYIRLYKKNDDNGKWISIHIEDDTLGFTASNITYLDGDDNEQSWDGTENLELDYEQEIKCSVNVKIGGFTEQRVTGVKFGDKLIFGDTGSRYYDLDIYTVNVLPKVTAYSNGTAVQLLTSVDKTEIVNMINTTEPESISEPEILELFNDEGESD